MSIDIDVCDMSTASGTGNASIGGLTSDQFIDIFRIVKEYPVAAIDVMEVNPSLDSTNKTCSLAARGLFEFSFLAGK